MELFEAESGHFKWERVMIENGDLGEGEHRNISLAVFVLDATGNSMSRYIYPTHRKYQVTKSNTIH